MFGMNNIFSFSNVLFNSIFVRSNKVTCCLDPIVIDCSFVFLFHRVQPHWLFCCQPTSFFSFEDVSPSWYPFVHPFMLDIIKLSNTTLRTIRLHWLAKSKWSSSSVCDSFFSSPFLTVLSPSARSSAKECKAIVSSSFSVDFRIPFFSKFSLHWDFLSCPE